MVWYTSDNVPLKMIAPIECLTITLVSTDLISSGNNISLTPLKIFHYTSCSLHKSGHACDISTISIPILIH